MRRRTGKGRIMKFTRYVAWLIVGAGLSGLNSLPAAQSDYPNKPVRFIVPFPPGGNVDLMARAIGQKLSENFGSFIKTEVAKWAKVVKIAGIRLE